MIGGDRNKFRLKRRTTDLTTDADRAFRAKARRAKAMMDAALKAEASRTGEVATPWWVD